MKWSCFINTISESNSQFQITVIASKFSVLPKFEEFGQIFPFWPAQKLSYASTTIMFSVCYSDTPSNQGFFKRQLFWDLPCLEENNFSPKKNCGSYFHETNKVVATMKLQTGSLIDIVKSLHLTQKLLLIQKFFLFLVFGQAFRQRNFWLAKSILKYGPKNNSIWMILCVLCKKMTDNSNFFRLLMSI